MKRERAQASTSILALVAAARVGVGAAMILAPSRIFRLVPGQKHYLCGPSGSVTWLSAPAPARPGHAAEIASFDGGQRLDWLVMEPTLSPGFAARR